ncbi:MAG: hypothetical protein GXO32_00755 [Crenarchaeota archaeon]|nr:hypothetical protein [Thermoproteota archaeon]
MITQRFCIGGLDKGNCIETKLLGKGRKRIAIIYSDPCVEAAVTKVCREYRNFSRFSVVFISLLSVVREHDWLRIALYSGFSVKQRFAAEILEKMMGVVKDFGTVVLIDCLGDSMPLTIAASQNAVPLSIGGAMCSCKDCIPELLNAVAKNGASAAWILAPCGKEFSASDVEKVVNIIKGIAFGAPVEGEGSVMQGECVVVDSPAAGLFVPEKCVGSEVVEGERIGTVEGADVRSPSDGVIAYISRGREVLPGESLCIVLRKTSL